MDSNPLAKGLSDPNLIGKLAANPRTSKYLADPSFMQNVSHPAMVPVRNHV